MHESTGSQRDAASTIFNLPNYRVIDAVDLPDGGRRVVIASTVPPGCPSCGVLATKDDFLLVTAGPGRSRRWRSGGGVGQAALVLLEPACARGTFAEATEQIPRYARSTTRLRDQVVSAVIRSGRAASEAARAHGVSWWLVQAALSAAAVVLPDVDGDVRVRRLGVDERRYRSVRWFLHRRGRLETVRAVDDDAGRPGHRAGPRHRRRPGPRAVGDWLAQRSEQWRERIEHRRDHLGRVPQGAADLAASCRGLGRQVPPGQARERHGHHRQAAPGPHPSRSSGPQGRPGLGPPDAAAGAAATP